MSTIRIVIDEDELALVCEALGRDVKPVSVSRGRVDKTVEPFHPSMGDPRLDAWMSGSRMRLGEPKPARVALPPKFPFGLKALDKNGREGVARFNEVAIAAWKRLGYEVRIERLPGDDIPRAALDGRNVTMVKP